jgi:hypothetical protein
VRVPDDQLDPRPLDGSVHARAVLQRQRHRLLADGVLAVRGGQDDVLGVALVRRSDVHGVHVGPAHESLTVGVGVGLKLRREVLPRLRARIGGGDQPHVGMRGQARQHRGSRPPEADYAEAQRSLHAPRYTPAGFTPGTTRRRSVVAASQSAAWGSSAAAPRTW